MKTVKLEIDDKIQKIILCKLKYFYVEMNVTYPQCRKGALLIIVNIIGVLSIWSLIHIHILSLFHKAPNKRAQVKNLKS